jgi:RHS repeat-associated protein
VFEPLIPLKVVSNKKITANSIVSEINYKYSTLRIHKQKGYLGFKSYTADDVTTKIKTVNDFGLNSTYFIPYLATQKQYKNNVPLSQVDNTFTFASKTGKRFFQYLSSTTQKNVLTNQTITTENNYNTSYGYLQSQNQIAGSDGSVNTIYSGYSAANFWQPTSVRTIRTQNGTFEISLGYTYDAFGNVLTSTDNDGNVTTITYNTDRTTFSKVTESGLVTESTFLYTEDGRITKKDVLFNNDQHHIETYAYNTDGNVTRSTNKNGLTSLYFYDKYGQLSAEVLPNGIRKAHTYGWGTSAGVLYTVFYKQTTDDVGNLSKTYFDKLGRQLSQESTPAGGIKAISNTYFNPDGSVGSEYSSVTGTTSYTYKTNGRLNSVTSMGKTTNYAYTAGTTTTTTNNISSSKTINAFGQLVKATDAGGEITYTYHASGNPETITTNGHTVTMGYDTKGRQNSLTDPDAGNNTYAYNRLGQLMNMTDGNENATTNTYDKLGRILTTSTVAGAGVAGAGSTRTLTYEYYSASPHLGYLKKVTDGESGIATSYTYDKLGRTTSVSEAIKGVTYTFNYEFDAQGKVTRMVYPDGFAITQSYKDNGNYIDKIRDEKASVDLFKAYTYNKWGQVTAYTQGNGNTVTNSFDETYGTIGSNTFGPSTNRIKYDYTFVPASGMLSQRSKQYLQNPAAIYTDAFTYDNLYRLTGWTVSQPNQANVAYSMDYSNNGNLVQKSDIGFYDYASAQPHAVSSVSQLSGDAFSTKYNKITYNSFNSVAKAELSATDIDPVTNTYTLTYGPDNQRRISNSDGAETIYVGLYEVRSNGDRLHYIPTPDGLCGLVVTNGATQTNYYLHNDHLGSLVAAEAQDGTLTEYSYDPWGRRRNPTNWNDYAVTAPTLFTRGFTGHEHMDAYGLINMNGRVYDPRLGRMLSPDNYVQAPSYTQSYNRYSYCMNNPMMFTDPSGEKFKWPKFGGIHWIPVWGQFVYAMDIINANTVEVRQEMVDAGVPNFSVGVTSNGETFHTIGNNEPIYHNRVNADYSGSVDRAIYEVRSEYMNEWHAQSGGGNLSMVEERFIQATGILGFSGPTIGLSIAKFPNGEFGVYWNNGNTTGVDLPNLDIGVTTHTSKNPDINWEKALQGWSSSYGGSFSFFAATVGGNQYSGDFFSTFMKDYGSVSIMLNLGPNDLAGGINKNTTNQQHLFTLPMWFDIFW